MNWQKLVGIDGSLLVDWLTDDVDNSSEGLWSDWDHDWVSGIFDILSSNESLSGVQCNGTHVVATEMLGDLKDESVFNTLDLEGVQDWWEVTLELHIDDGTDDLRDLANSGEVSLHYVVISQGLLSEFGQHIYQ